MIIEMTNECNGYSFYSETGLLNIIINVDRKYDLCSVSYNKHMNSLEYRYDDVNDNECSIKFIAETEKEANDLGLYRFDLYDRGQYHIVFFTIRAYYKMR